MQRNDEYPIFAFSGTRRVFPFHSNSIQMRIFALQLPKQFGKFIVVALFISFGIRFMLSAFSNTLSHWCCSCELLMQKQIDLSGVFFC